MIYKRLQGLSKGWEERAARMIFLGSLRDGGAEEFSFKYQEVKNKQNPSQSQLSEHYDPWDNLPGFVYLVSHNPSCKNSYYSYKNSYYYTSRCFMKMKDGSTTTINLCVVLLSSNNC